ncbi:MAG: NTP transferase domain-containing protein [Burkholderiales bacterium]
MIAGILLAAGRGERFGGRKLLAKLDTGKTILETSARAIRRAVVDVTIVVRDDAELVDSAERIAAALGARLLINPRADEGMATSIGAGVKATPSASGWLIALADMPFVLPSTVRDVAEQIRSTSTIIVPTHRQQRGHPVGFGRDYFERLIALTGDTGARSVVQDHSAAVRVLPVDDAGVLIDIDTQADLHPG